MAKILDFPDKYPLRETPDQNFVEARITDTGIEYTYHAETYEDLLRLQERVRRG